MMGYRYGLMGGFGMMIIPLLLVGLIIYAAVKFSQGNNNNNNYNNNRGGSDALDILNQRYAKGEISEEEYVIKKKMLRD